MGTFGFPYIEHDSLKRKYSINGDAKRIKISISDATEIDLSPLASCQALQMLKLRDMDSLQALDLSPLVSCQALQVLELERRIGLTRRANLYTIDLSPLFRSDTLHEVIIHRAQSIFSQKTVVEHYAKWEEEISAFDTPSIFSDTELVRSILATLLSYEPEPSWKTPHLVLQISQKVLPEIGIIEHTGDETRELVSVPESELSSVLSTLYKEHIEGGGNHPLCRR